MSFKTFVADHFARDVKKLTGLDIQGNFGIDQKTVLGRKLGLKRSQGKTDRQNEVWAGKPVNMAAKLAGVSSNNNLWVSDRYYGNLRDEKATMTCGCPDGEKTQLWKREDVSADGRFDFDVAYSLASNWCRKHGKNFCAELLKCDAD